MIIIVDLDRTILPFDSTVYSIKYVLLNRPTQEIMVNLSKGRKKFKLYLVENVDWSTVDIPINKAVMDFVIEMKKKGSAVYLVSGSNEKLVNAISNRIGIFDKSIGSSQLHSKLKFKNKLVYINRIVGVNDWVYIADAYRDVSIWEKATTPILVSNSRIKFLLISRFRIKNLQLIKPNSSHVFLPKF